MSRQEDCRPQVVDGVRCCVGKVQVVNRYPWMLAVFSPTQQCPSTNSSIWLCVRHQAAGWLCEPAVLQAPWTAPTVVPSSSSIVPHRLPHTVPPPTLSMFALFTFSDALRVCLVCLVCRHVSSKNALFQHFELTSTTAHCSVPMPKHPSDKAGPSDRCAMPS